MRYVHREMRRTLILGLVAVAVFAARPALASTGANQPAAAPKPPAPPPQPPQPPPPPDAEPTDAQPAGPPASEPPPPEPATPPPAPETPLPDEGAPPPDLDDDSADAGAPPHADTEYGPVIQIERIDVTGNTATRAEIIRRAMPITAGDVLHASDKRLRNARFKVLALGFFRDVTLTMHRGSQRGRVIVEVHVIERGTLQLNRLWFGTTELTPWWLGADVSERNLLGLGISVGGGFVYAHHGDIVGARDQYAGEIRIADPSVRGTRWGTSFSATLVHGSEPYRVSGAPSDTSARTQNEFPYSRIGFRLGASYDITALTRLTMGIRAEQIDVNLPVAPTQLLPDGRAVAVDLHLDPGISHVTTASLGIDRDTRSDPILPHSGDHLALSVELGSALLGGSYDFATMVGRYERYWPVTEHQAIAIKTAGGVVVGDAPRFDRIYIGDVDTMLTPRALGLVLSSAAPLAILGTRADKPTYGDIGGYATVEYAIELFRGSGRTRLYGGDVFIGVGLWALAERDELRTRDTSITGALPFDLYTDAGFRLDTDIGTFEITIASALGRLR